MRHTASQHSLNWLPHNIRIPMILLSTATSHHVCRPLMIHIVAHHAVECRVAVVMLIRVVMVILWADGVVTMTTGGGNLLLRSEMRLLAWWRLQLLTIARTIRRTLAIRCETIWCRYWRLATGCSTIVEWWSDGRRFLRDLSSNVRLIWFYFTCTAITIKRLIKHCNEASIDVVKSKRCANICSFVVVAMPRRKARKSAISVRDNKAHTKKLYYGVYAIQTDDFFLGMITRKWCSRAVTHSGSGFYCRHFAIFFIFLSFDSQDSGKGISRAMTNKSLLRHKNLHTRNCFSESTLQRVIIESRRQNHKYWITRHRV